MDAFIRWYLTHPILCTMALWCGGSIAIAWAWSVIVGRRNALEAKLQRHDAAVAEWRREQYPHFRLALAIVKEMD